LVSKHQQRAVYKLEQDNLMAVRCLQPCISVQIFALAQPCPSVSVQVRFIWYRCHKDTVYLPASCYQSLYSLSDIKAKNIGFDVRGIVKIFDFDLVKSLHPDLHNHADGL
jgi:hypothetical protein